MILRPPCSTRSDPLFPVTTLCRSEAGRRGQVGNRQIDEDRLSHDGSPLTLVRLACGSTRLRDRADCETGVSRTRDFRRCATANPARSDEHTSELQSLMRNSYAVFCLKKITSNISNELCVRPT